MDHFHYKNNRLFCDGVDLERLSAVHPTPYWVYSRSAFEENLAAFQKAFRSADPLICYSVKSNGSLGVLKVLKRLGAGFDIVSGGELFRVRQAGGDMSRVVFAGVGKTEAEIRDALKAGILMFNCESAEEMARIDAVCRSLGRRARIGVRLNPDVDADTHAHITTGTAEKKFGLLREDLLKLLPVIRKFRFLDWKAVHLHIGSQITTTAPFKQSVLKALRFIADLRERGVAIDTLNLGGGLGVSYDGCRTQNPADLAAAVLPLVKSRGLKLILEPGRYISATAGALIATVQYVKRGHVKKFVITDAGMTELVRPALYDAFHRIVPLVRDQKGLFRADVVGPVCESTDWFAKDRLLPRFRQGDRIAVLTAGAYGAVMSSRYNGRPLAAEILVVGRKARTIRKRETYGDMVRQENV